MDLDPEEPVDLCRVRSPFEADTIAACLQDRGFRACAMTLAAGTVQWEGGITNVPRIQVPRCELAEAQAVLEAVKEQAKSIDWEQELEKQESGAPGAVCAFCGGSREGLDNSKPCPACGNWPEPLKPQLDDVQVSKMRLRTKHLLYFGIALIVLPIPVGLLIEIVMRVLRR